MGEPGGETDGAVRPALRQEVPAPARCEAALPGFYLTARPARTLVPRHPPHGTVNNLPVPSATPRLLAGKLRHGEE